MRYKYAVNHDDLQHWKTQYQIIIMSKSSSLVWFLIASTLLICNVTQSKVIAYPLSFMKASQPENFDGSDDVYEVEYSSMETKTVDLTSEVKSLSEVPDNMLYRRHAPQDPSSARNVKSIRHPIGQSPGGRMAGDSMGGSDHGFKRSVTTLYSQENEITATQGPLTTRPTTDFSFHQAPQSILPPYI